MLDYASEDIDGMDDDVEAEPGQNPPITGHWMATSNYDVYMVDMPEKKDGDGTQDLDEDKPVDEPPKCQRHQRRSRSRRERERNIDTGDNDTRIMPKTPQTPWSLLSSRMKGKKVNSASKNSPITKIRKMVTTYLSLKRMSASVMRTSSS